MTKLIKTRFAPSPTGFLHVGGLRTALFNYLWAKKNNGQFVLRIEDTDQSREVEGAAKNLQDMLKIFNLNYDDGPIFQSKRLNIYKEHAEILIEKGKAYLDESDPEKGAVIRQKIPREGETAFADLVYGDISVENHRLDEGVLIKSDGFPTYNFANVVDDHLMGITHVLRGEEFISSTPKHVLLYQSFGWEIPQFAHLPLILNQQRKKLSKRDGDVAVEEYLNKAYLPEALLNFIALLGWNPKTEKEIFSLSELIENFDIKKINKSGSIFDINKLDFINREWQSKLNAGSEEPMFKKAKTILQKKYGDGVEDVLEKIWPFIVERIQGPSQLEEKLPEFSFFFENPDPDPEMIIWKNTNPKTIKENLMNLHDYLESNWEENVSSINTESKIKGMLEAKKIPTGEALWPLRVALTGMEKSPGPFEIISVFSHSQNGKQIVLDRIKNAVDKL